MNANIRIETARFDWLNLVLGISFSLFICAVIVLSLVPPVSRDALTHHLAVPKLWLRHGGMYEIPFMPYSYFPMNLDLLYLVALYLGNDIAPKLIHFCFALLTAWLIFSFLKQRFRTSYGLFGALFFLSVPIVVKLSITVYVDLGLIFFSTASLLWLIKWRESGFKFRFLVISAVFCGVAIGTKYNGLISLFLLTSFVPLIYQRGNGQGNSLKGLQMGALFFFTALIVVSPWLIRNYVWTGNPIYPLYNQWFNPSTTQKGTGVGLFGYRSLVYGESWWEIMLLPLRIFFQGQDNNPQFFDGKLNPFLLIFTLFAFFRRKDDARETSFEISILTWFSALFFFFALFSTSLRIRYIAPIVAPLVILSAIGVKKAFDLFCSLHSSLLRRIGISLVTGSIILTLGLNARYLIGQFEYVKPFSYLAGKVSRDEYIEIHRPEYAVLKYINNNLPEDAKILFIFMGNRGYYCDRCYIFDMVWNKSGIAGILKKTRDPSALWNNLRSHGITHMLFNINILNKWVNQTFNVEQKKKLKLFFDRYTRNICSKNGYALLAVRLK